MWSAPTSFLFPKPRVLLTWSPESSDQLRLRVEREVGQLDFNNFAASGSLGTGTHAGNPQPDPAAGLGDRGRL